MRATGMVRKIDDLGRMVVPKEIRENLGWEMNDSIEIFVDEDAVLLKKYRKGCFICGNVTDESVNIKHINLCDECIRKLKESNEGA